ncbi:hypothetical protein HDU79_001551 [Rhizoclosmatium sp. JEL0117]|nr:hypothetical protein HDU79_001551 [Rhizoclosmatium sp. JEL0117]
MRSDISDAWNEEDSRTEGGEGVGDVMNEGGLALKLAVEAATERLGAIRGNSIKRIGCCTSDVGLCDKKVAVIVGNGGWRGEVEFESDTICYGDRRRIYYQVHDPEYFKLMKEQRNLTDFDTMNGQIVKVRRGTAQFEVILVESWNWIGIPDKFGSREISLLKTSESEMEEFSERQLVGFLTFNFVLV